MPIYTIAQYKVRPGGIETVKRAIQEFVPYVTAHEPGTRMYLAWQQQDDPTRFVHFFIFENEAAHEAHSRSEAVKRFEAAYGPELDGGGTFFNGATVYRLRPTVEQPPTQAEWICETGDEWSGTRIAFELEPVKSGTVLRFKHAGWRAESNYFVSCNTTWGELMFRLKDAAEGRARGPLFS